MELNDPPNSSSNDSEGPVFGQAAAPDHGAGFWSSLEGELHADVVAANTVVPGIEVVPSATEVIAAVPSDAAPISLESHRAERFDRTEQLVAVPSQPNGTRGRWPVLAAAAAVLFIGLAGFGLLRGTTDQPGELVAAGVSTPGAVNNAPLAQGDSPGADESGATEAAATTAAATPTSRPEPTASADSTERFLVQNDDRLLFFVETIATGAVNCVHPDQNAVVVHAPDGTRTNLPGRVYPHVDKMIVQGELFALTTSDCNGAQMLEAGRIEPDGRLITSRTIRGRVSDDSPAIFQGVNIDVDTGSLSFEDAPLGSTDFSPQLVEIDPPIRPTPVPDPTATPSPAPTATQGSFFDKARLVGSSVDGNIDWFAVVDPSTTCVDDDYAQIMVIAAGGPANVVHSPQFTYSGDVAFFTADDATKYAAFVTSCGSQLELNVALIGTAGTFVRSDVAWVGLGSPDNALVVWEDDTVTFNSLQADGTPFFVEYDASAGRITDSNVPSRSVSDGGSPEGLHRSPVGAAPGGGLVYYNGDDPDKDSGCEGRPNTLWVQNAAGTWSRAVSPDLDLQIVSAFAFEQASAQVAFGDTCESNTSTLYVGLAQADGRIINVRSISMTPYVPGNISSLSWIDPSRVRIETDNSAWDVDPKRFEYDLRSDVMVQLDR